MYSTSESQLSKKGPEISLELYDELGILSDEIDGHYLFGFFQIWPYLRQNPM